MTLAETPAGPLDNVVRTRSAFGMDETTDRLRAAVAAQGMAILAEVDHAAGAGQAGLTMKPMVMLAFGNAKAGTPLMQAAPTIGIDLPLKALVWTDRDGAIWVAVNHPARIAARHGALAGHEAIVAAMQRALDAVVAAATTG